jgi:hypothetical protein
LLLEELKVNPNIHNAHDEWTILDHCRGERDQAFEMIITLCKDRLDPTMTNNVDNATVYGHLFPWYD